MRNTCEDCPIPKKITICCPSNPDTGETRTIRLSKSRQITTVCSSLENDGTCGGYGERPEPCRAYVCEEIYVLGLNSSNE